MLQAPALLAPLTLNRPRQCLERAVVVYSLITVARVWPTALGSPLSGDPLPGSETATDLGGRVERVTGIEPALSAWEADVLPLNYTREWWSGYPVPSGDRKFSQ
jgi:hypothetical protein